MDVHEFEPDKILLLSGQLCHELVVFFCLTILTFSLRQLILLVNFERRIQPSFNELFCNQETLWKDNNRLMREFMELIENKN